MWRKSGLTRDGTAYPVSRDRILGLERGPGKKSFCLFGLSRQTAGLLCLHTYILKCVVSYIDDTTTVDGESTVLYYHRLPKRVMSGELENAGKRGPGGKEKEWTDCVADDLRLFGVTGDWRTAALDPGAWYNTVQEGGCRFMAAWVREEENASNQRQKKREAEEADKVEVAPGVTVASLRRFRTALIGPT